MLSDQRTELGAAQEHRPRFFRRARIGDVMTVGRQSFASKRLARCGNHRNESATDFDFVAQYDVTIEHNEHAVRGRATLVKLEALWPARPRTVRRYWRQFIRSES